MSSEGNDKSNRSVTIKSKKTTSLVLVLSFTVLIVFGGALAAAVVLAQPAPTAFPPLPPISPELSAAQKVHQQTRHACCSRLLLRLPSHQLISKVHHNRLKVHTLLIACLTDLI